MAKKATKKPVGNRSLVRNVVPDRLDLRDRMYLPPVAVIPGQTLEPNTDIPVLNQEDTSACTGFALASVVYHLQRKARRDVKECRVSPFMLYSMARRYDEFPGSPDTDTGSSARGAMKGWFKCGACEYSLWPTEKCPRRRSRQKTIGGWTRCAGRSAPITASTRARSPTCTWR